MSKLTEAELDLLSNALNDNDGLWDSIQNTLHYWGEKNNVDTTGVSIVIDVANGEQT